MSVRIAMTLRAAPTLTAPGRAEPPLDGVERLVAIRSDRLGDLLLTLPAVAALRAAYPAARLALAVAPAWVELARHVEGVDRVLEWHGPSTVSRLREFAPDLAVCVTRNAEVAWVAARAGIRHRVGTARRVYSPLFTRRVRGSRRSTPRHEAEHALDFAAIAGARATTIRFPLRLSTGALAAGRVAAERVREACGVGPDAPLAVLHAGSGGSCPRWPLRRHGELARRLRDRGWGVAASVGPGERTELADAVAVRPDPVGLAGLLAAAGAVVASSTGPIHLAAALGTPALAIHAPWRSCGAARWAPLAERAFTLTVGDERHARWSRRRRRRQGEALLAELPASVVADTLDSLARGETPRQPSQAANSE